jgi:hypothetical protein
MDRVTKKNMVSFNALHFFPSCVYTKLVGSAGLDLALHRLVQSNPVWYGLIWPFIHEFKTISHL